MTARSIRRRTAAALAVLALAVAGCSGGEDEPTGTAAEPSPTSDSGPVSDVPADGTTPTTAPSDTPTPTPTTQPAPTLGPAPGPGAEVTSAPVPGAGITSGHTGTWAAEPATGDFTLADDVPPQPYQFLWYLELPEGSQLQPNAPAGYTIAMLPSGCEFRAFQGSVTGSPALDVSDEVGTQQVGDLLRQQFASEGITDFQPLDPLVVPLNHDDGTLELQGMSASYTAEDAPWLSRTYYRGMPGSDSALFLTLSCASDAMDDGAGDLEDVLESSAVIPGP